MSSFGEKEAHLYVAIILGEENHQWRDLRVFGSPFSAKQWIETEIRTPIDWSDPGDCMVVQGIKEENYEQSPARIHRVTIPDPVNVAKTWGLDVEG